MWRNAVSFFFIAAAACGIVGIVPAKVFFTSAFHTLVLGFFALFLLLRFLEKRDRLAKIKQTRFVSFLLGVCTRLDAMLVAWSGLVFKAAIQELCK